MSEPKLTTVQSAAVNRLGENIALSSGAGCGKTFVLARRFTNLLLGAGGENPLRRLVALTFTDKAALEMSQRVRKFLSDLAGQSKGDDRRRILEWLDELPQSRISTIHGFCAALLRSTAIQAGVDPSFEVLADDFVGSQMVDQAVRAGVLAAVLREDSGAAGLLVDEDYETVVSLVAQLVDDRTSWRIADYSDPAATLDRWRQMLANGRRQQWQTATGDAAFGQARQALADLACRDDADPLCVLRAEILACTAKADADDAAAHRLAEIIDEGPGRLGSVAAWGKGGPKIARDAVKNLLGRLDKWRAFCAELGSPDDKAARNLAALTALAQEANTLYTAAKRERGVLDFTDLLEHTHRLLAASPALRSALARDIDQLLIDECQDTDEFQIRLLMLLVGAVGGPDEPAIPPGRLFLVGDRKQSIYRFRGAQVEVYEQLCGRIGHANQLELDVSFRTHDAGLQLVNHIFGQQAPGDAPLLDSYKPVSASRKELPPQPAAELLLATATPWGEKVTSQDTATAATACLVAQRIEELLHGGQPTVWDGDAKQWRTCRAGDIAILFSRMTHSSEYERQLALRDIPYYVVSGSGFFRRQEIFDVLSALAAIDSPRDDIAFVGVLRGAMVGLDDNVLMHLSQACPQPYLPTLAGMTSSAAAEHAFAELARRIDTRALAALRHAVDMLTRLSDRKDSLTIDELIRRLLDQTGYEATLLAGRLGRREVANVHRLIDYARAAHGNMSLAQFIAQTRKQIVTETQQEQAAVAGEADDVVRLMTVHKAKGLEFPVVILPDLNAGKRQSSTRMLRRSDWGLTLKTDGDDDDSAGAVHQAATALEQRDDLREDIRRMYVAVTRHEDLLIFVGADLRTKDECFHKNCWMERLDRRLGIVDAVKAGATSIPYGQQGQYRMTLRCQAPTAAEPRGPRKSAGQLLLDRCPDADSLAAALSERPAGAPRGAQDSASALPLLGPLPADIGSVEMAVTVLGEFECCPMLYRWRYELRVPQSAIVRPSQSPAGANANETAHAPAAPGGMGPAQLGTFYHRCMQLIDFAHPQPCEQLVAQAAADLELDEGADLSAVAADLSAMTARMKDSGLLGELAAARAAWRELDFVMRLGPLTLRGQIDLIFQDSAGDWHIVDYKSDSVTADGVAAHAARYELQLMLYSQAALRKTGQAPRSARLYFLRPGVPYSFDVSAASMAQTARRAEDLAHQIIAARRSGVFPRSSSAKACSHCAYSQLCGDFPNEG